MESTYSIGVENRYQLFLDSDDDPLEVLKISGVESKSKKNKLSENKSKEADAPRQVSQKSINNTKNVKIQEAMAKEKKSNFNKSQVTNICITDESEFKGKREFRRQDRGVGDQQTAFGFNNKKEQDNRYDRKNNAVRNYKNTGKSFKDNKQEETDAIKSTNNDTNKRGGYSNRKLSDRASRSSKTGIKSVDKREGGGAHNWGSYQDELNEGSNVNNEPLNDQDEIQKNDERNLEFDGNEEEQKSPLDESDKPEIKQEEPKEMTLDEYKALRGNRQKPMYNLRKANEGEDPSQWKKMYTLPKSENEEEEEEYERIEYPQRAGRQKLLLGIKYFFKDRFARVGRVKRGGSRMGSARNDSDANDSYILNNENDKAENLSQDTPNVNDEKDFPSLG